MTITDTQPDQTAVSTGAGNDTILVGGGVASLDDIEGPLTIDAGPGQNQITFNDRPSNTGDILTLTSSLVPAHANQGSSTPEGFLLRYWDKSDATARRRGPAYRYPMDITFMATGGDFSQGVSLFGTSSTDPNHPDQIYVESVLPNAPTTVRTYGVDDEVFAGFDGGPNWSHVRPRRARSTTIASTLPSIDQTGTTTDLTVDDVGTARGDTYDVTASEVTRENTPVTIQYQSLGQLVVAAATPENNIIDVTGTASGTPTTVDAGDGNNTISVADPSDTIDEVLGPLTVNGGTGMDPLAIDDSGNGQSQVYELTASELVRTGPPLIEVSFQQISSLSFHASENNGINEIAVSGTPAGVPVGILTGQGNANLNVSTFDDIQGPLSFQWSQGTKTLQAQDLTAGENAVYQVLPNQIQRTGAAAIAFNYASDPLASMSLAAGLLHHAEIDVPATIKATPVSLFLGTAADDVLVSESQETLDTIGGQLSIQANGTTTALLSDQNAPQGRSYTAGRWVRRVQSVTSLDPVQLPVRAGPGQGQRFASLSSMRRRRARR